MPQCLHVQIRGDKKRCENDAETPYGFCKKHVRTIQARNTKEKYENSLQKPPEQKTVPVNHRGKPTPPIMQRKIVIKKNEWGRFEDPATHILFEKNTKYACGVQEPDGRVKALSPSHIAICIENGWNYFDPAEVSSDSEEENIVSQTKKSVRWKTSDSQDESSDDDDVDSDDDDSDDDSDDDDEQSSEEEESSDESSDSSDIVVSDENDSLSESSETE